MTVMSRRFTDIHDTLVRSEDRPALEAWIRRLLRPISDELGDQPSLGEPDDRRILRASVLHMLASFGRDPQTLSSLRTVVDAYMKAPDSIDAALAENALTISAQQGDPPLYDQYLLHLKTAKTPEEYGLYL